MRSSGLGPVLLAATGFLLLPGCVTKIVTAPIKATSKVVDWTTTSGDEADRARGRDLREKCKKDPDPKYCKGA